MRSGFIQKGIIGKTLRGHLVAVKSVTAEKIVDEPNYLLKSGPPSGKQNHKSPISIPESEWVAHFKSQSVKPNSRAERSFDSEIASLLDSIQKPSSIVIIPSFV